MLDSPSPFTLKRSERVDGDPPTRNRVLPAIYLFYQAYYYILLQDNFRQFYSNNSTLFTKTNGSNL